MHINQLQQLLKTSLAEVLYLQSSEIDADKSFIDLGLDSIVGVEWVKVINKELGLEIPSTKIYDYSTINILASFLAKELENMPVSSAPESSINQIKNLHKMDDTPLSDKKISSNPPAIPVFPASVTMASMPLLNSLPHLERKIYGKQSNGNNTFSDDKIAIIGMSGRYPQANNLNQYWENLVQGKNSIVEIPSLRWDINQYYDPDPNKKGKIYCKWLGMLDDIDCFDPLFFQINPAEAEVMDPQHRIFLQESYKAFEDAGYSSSSLSNTKCGVYLGIMSNDYSYHLSKNKSSSINVTGNSFSIGVARLSYFLNLKGPAIPVDTACSSSLVSIHLACQGLLNHEIDMALAGGVSLYLIPESYIGMCQAGMLSPQGQCKTFDNSANGFVPGEGVGALVLKRLKDAERDNDFIYGVIVGSGINQDGKTNGITAPSINSQIELERDLYTRYNIDPNSINYVETHGTGTKLGDPIELEALATVFKEKTSKKNYCALGSVKTNIGHTSGAAGVASIQKVLLSMQHKTLVPTLNITDENTLFDFKNSPFYISRKKQDWNTVTDGSLRRAGISSFGFSGTNAHLILEEYPWSVKRSITPQDVVMIALSARTVEQLKQKVSDLLDFICQNEPSISLVNMAYTLQVGRDKMKERLGFIVGSIDQLKEKLQAYMAGVPDIDIYQGQMTRDKDTLSMFGTDADLQNIADKWISDKKYAKLLDLWVKGLELDWNKFYGDDKPQRMSLPTYPFAKERYWVDLSPDSTSVSQETKKVIKVKTTQEEENNQRMHYYPTWKESQLSVPPELKEDFFVNGPFLIIDTTDDLYLAIKTKLEESLNQNPVILVKPGDSYQKIESTIFTVNFDQESHLYQLVEDLKVKEMLPRQIVHQGLLNQLFEEKYQMNQLLNYNFYSLFYLCKVLIKQKCKTPLRIVSSFINTNIVAPQNAALGSFFKTLTLENPGYEAKIIEIQDNLVDQQVSISEKIRFIFDEFKDQNWKKNEIYYRFEKDKQLYVRYVKELIPFIPAKNKTTELPIKQRGVYIVSGGLGGLGLIFSEYLVKNFQCNLVLFGRSALKKEQEAILNQLKAYNTEVVYIQADVSDLKDMIEIVRTTKERFSQINGVIHAAGVNEDSFIINKSKETIEKVLAPKIYGTINLDEATKEEKIDLFIMFSSIASIMGNLGQSDYAFGNHFLDSFAEIRENLKKDRKRFGQTLSINWPYWEKGGMTLSQDEIALAKKQIGISPLSTEDGIRYYEEFLQSGLIQGVVLYGLSSKIKAYIESKPLKTGNDKPVLTSTIDENILADKIELYLKTVIGEEIKLTPDKLDSKERFDSFGIDSIVVNRINASLERDLGNLPRTLFYQYETIEELGKYLIQEEQQSLIRFFNMEGSDIKSDTADEEIEDQHVASPNEKYDDSEPIAIIGVHGYYPQSKDLDTYWENLKQGNDLIELVPSSRWNYEEFYHKDPEKASNGKIYCKWGGFLNDIDKFDPLFFNISAEEAKTIDPQERLFLESVWSAIEDAGYTKESLRKCHPKAKDANVGVFVGVTTNSYNLLGAEDWKRNSKSSPAALPWSIANRVSYFFGFQGPSMPVDTACSSSLVAIHLACESLKKQECQVAIAGGVNLYLHPSKYHSFCLKRMVTLDNKCRSYGAGGDGFVPGEGVGAIVLKPLSKAIENQDHIYAVIQGSAFAHSGRSNGYSAPNPNSQSDLISEVLNKGKINPETISYIEGHGTGTQLGDSLEIVALTNAFRKQTKKKQFCPIGSVKANIGHPESAAGIAGVTKILLQMKHKQLVPTIHSDEVNPNIEFGASPFYLQHKLTHWESRNNLPRRALINSFGAGGVNACIILDEYIKPATILEETKQDTPYLIILSAKNKERLHESVNQLHNYVEKEKNMNLSDLAYTLQVGREAMPERLAIVVSDRLELIEKLEGWNPKQASDNVYYGSSEEPRQEGKKCSKKDIENLDTIEMSNIHELAQMWVDGLDMDWEILYSQNKPIRLALPTYPFAKERCWISDNSVRTEEVSDRKNAQLHPLVSYNSSTLKGVTFSSLLLDNEFYALDHKVNEEYIFPGSGFLEIANVSGNMAKEEKVSKIKDVVWIHPLSFRKGTQLVQTFLKENGNSVNYQITSLDDENEKMIHSEGKLFFENNRNHSDIAENMPVKVLKERCSKSLVRDHFYNLFKKSGLSYGMAFQTVQEFYVNDSYALSKLEIADCLKVDFERFILHPSLLDGALQTVVGLTGNTESGKAYLPFAIDEIEIMRSLTPTCYVYAELVDSKEHVQKDIQKFNIQILNENGDVLIRLKNFYARAFDKVKAN